MTINPYCSPSTSVSACPDDPCAPVQEWDCTWDLQKGIFLVRTATESTVQMPCVKIAPIFIIRDRSGQTIVQRVADSSEVVREHGHQEPGLCGGNADVHLNNACLKTDQNMANMVGRVERGKSRSATVSVERKQRTVRGGCGQPASSGARRRSPAAWGGRGSKEATPSSGCSAAHQESQ